MATIDANGIAERNELTLAHIKKIRNMPTYGEVPLLYIPRTSEKDESGGDKRLEHLRATLSLFDFCGFASEEVIAEVERKRDAVEAQMIIKDERHARRREYRKDRIKVHARNKSNHKQRSKSWGPR